MSAPDGNSLFVKAIRAVTPAGSRRVSASWIAFASGFGGGVDPEPPRAATAIAARDDDGDDGGEQGEQAVDAAVVRKIFTAVLSRGPHREGYPSSLKLS